MFCELLGLARSPFDDPAESSPYYPAPSREAKLSSLQGGILEGRNVVVLVGEPGVGKTALAWELRRRIESSAEVGWIACEGESSADLAARACEAFGVGVGATASPSAHVERLRTVLARHVGRQRPQVLFVDAVERLDAAALAQARLLCDIQPCAGRRLQLVLVGRPAALEALRRSEFGEIRERVSVARKIEPLSPDEVIAYVRHRIEAAGGAPDRVLTPGALELIAQQSCGVPAAANRVAAAAIECARTDGVARISEDIVRAARVDLAKSLHDAPRTAGVTRRPVECDPREPVAPSDSTVDSTVYEDHSMSGSSQEAIVVAAKLASDQAEATLRRIEHAAASADERAVAIESRLRAVLDRAEDTLARLSRSAAAVDQTGAVVQSRLLDATCACDRADAMREQMTQLVAQLKPVSESVQERIALLTAGLGAGEAAHERLRDVADDVATQTTEFHRTSQERLTRLEQTAAQCDALSEGMERLCREIMEQLERQAQRVSETSTGATQELTRRAEAILEDLRGQAAGVVSESQSTLASARSDADAFLTGLRDGVSATMAQTDTAMKSARRDAEGAVREAGVAAGSLRAESESLLEGARRTVEETREAIESAAAGSRSTAEEALGQVRRETETALEQLRAGGESVGEAVQGIVAECQQQARGAAALIRAESESARADVESVLRNASRSVAELQQTVQHCTGAAHADIERILARGEEEASALDKHLRETMRGLEEQAGQWQARLVADARRTLDTAADELVRQCHNRVTSAGEAACAEWEHGLHQLEERARRVTGETTRRVAEAIQEGQRGAAEIETRLADASGTCKARVAEAEERIAALQGAVGRSDEAVERAGALESRLEVVHREAREIESAMGETLRRGEQAVHDTRGTIQDAVESASHVAADVRADAEAARTATGQLASHLSAAHSIARTLTEADARAQESIGQLNAQHSSIESLHARMKSEAEATGERLQTATGVARRVVGRLIQQVKHEVQTAREHKETLGQHCQEGAELLRGLGEACEDAKRSEPRLRALAQELESLSETTRTCAQTCIHSLAREIDRGEQTRTQVEASTTTAQSCCTEIVKGDERARRALEELDARIQSQQGILQASAEATAQAQEVLGRLSTAEQNARRALAESRESLTRAEETTSRAAACAADLDTHKERIDQHEQALRTLDERRAGLQRQLEALGVPVQALRVQLDTLLAQPRTVVGEANQHVARLQELGTAVKKVSAGLSQACGDANRKIEELNRLERVAAAWKDWIGQTAATQEHLSGVLRQQSQLLSVLALPPSAEKANAGAAAAPVPPRLEAASDAAVRRSPAGETPVEAAIAHKKKRAEEINRLIREVRQRSESASRPRQPVPAQETV